MTDKPVRPKVILIREEPLKSWLRDASTFALFVCLIGVGWLMGSDAMQWVGAGVAFTTLFAQFSGRKKEWTFTIAEARAELDRLEGVKAR